MSRGHPTGAPRVYAQWPLEPYALECPPAHSLGSPWPERAAQGEAGTERMDQGQVIQDSLFPPSAFVQCDNSTCVFFVEGWIQRIPSEKRQRRILTP